ncbi:MAG TPA: AAA family ATPase [Solirubrobacteraceae bacterium]|nr:AAA family ATPase [Solirubrobacteraceae bacterium]
MKSLSIALLGAPRIEVDGRPIEVDTRKATALFAFLAVTGHTHTRAVLANLLWPEADPERSRSALRRTLSTLRGALGEERLITDRQAVRLDLDGASFDLERFRRTAADPAAGIEELAAAVALHRDELMAGFALRDSVEFDDWQRAEAETIRRERAAALDRLADALASQGRFEEAINAARQRLALDLLHEPTHRRLIDLYARAGRRKDALLQYRECVRALDRELGVAPLRETTDLFNAINGGTVATAVASSPTEPLASELPLAGRGAEVAQILAAFERASLLVIEGESGVGKTRLAAEALAEISDRDGVVLAARPHPGEQALAYGVTASLLRAAIGGEHAAVEDAMRADAARLLPELGEAATGSLDEPGARLRFLEAVSAVVIDSFDGAPGVIWIDDLHWCDPASLEALSYLARRIATEPLLLLCARRTDEPDPDRLHARFAALGGRLALGRLARAEVVSLALQRGLDEAGADAVFRDSEGLPLFVAELLAPGAAPGGGVRAAVEARLDAVGDAASQVLGAAALLGRTFDADTLRIASGRSEEEVAGALDELGARGLILESGLSYDFTHERLRAIAEERVGLARRRLLHRRIAAALTERHGDVAIVARHLELAGDDEAAAIAHAVAGSHARALSAALEAVSHFEAAIALGHPDAAGLQETIGDLHTLRGAYGAALASYAAAAAYGEAAAAGRLEQKLGGVHERRGEWELAERRYEDALALGADEAIVQCDRSRVAWRRGELAQARALGFEALRLAERSGATAAAAQANNILGLLGCGRDYLRRSLDLAGELADPGIRIAALNNLARDHAAAGELARAQELLREALEQCAAEGDLHHESALRNNLADVLHRAGSRDQAMAELKLAVTGFAAIGAEDELRYPGIWDLAEW